MISTRAHARLSTANGRRMLWVSPSWGTAVAGASPTTFGAVSGTEGWSSRSWSHEAISVARGPCLEIGLQFHATVGVPWCLDEVRKQPGRWRDPRPAARRRLIHGPETARRPRVDRVKKSAKSMLSVGFRPENWSRIRAGWNGRYGAGAPASAGGSRTGSRRHRWAVDPGGSLAGHALLRRQRGCFVLSAMSTQAEGRSPRSSASRDHGVETVRRLPARTRGGAFPGRTRLAGETRHEATSRATRRRGADGAQISPRMRSGPR